MREGSSDTLVIQPLLVDHSNSRQAHRNPLRRAAPTRDLASGAMVGKRLRHRKSPSPSLMEMPGTRTGAWTSRKVLAFLASRSRTEDEIPVDSRWWRCQARYRAVSRRFDAPEEANGTSAFGDSNLRSGTSTVQVARAIDDCRSIGK